MRWGLRSVSNNFEREWNFVGLATPGAIQVSDQLATVGVYTMSPGRIGALVAVVLGLTGAVIGRLALSRSAAGVSTGNGRRRATIALVLGAIGLFIGGLVVATAQGGLGTGHGFGGGIVAMIVGLIGMTLGWLAQARSRSSG